MIKYGSKYNIEVNNEYREIAIVHTSSRIEGCYPSNSSFISTGTVLTTEDGDYKVIKTESKNKDKPFIVIELEKLS